jgi:hypothetical protein
MKMRTNHPGTIARPLVQRTLSECAGVERNQQKQRGEEFLHVDELLAA